MTQIPGGLHSSENHTILFILKSINSIWKVKEQVIIWHTGRCFGQNTQPNNFMRTPIINEFRSHMSNILSVIK